jgi:hypothetical protein
MKEYTIGKEKLGSWLERFVSLAWQAKLTAMIYHKPAKKWSSILFVDGNTFGLANGKLYTPVTDAKVRLLK